MRLLSLVPFAFLVISSSIFAQPNTTYDVQYYYSEGLQAYQSGDFPGFKNSFLEAAKLRPSNPTIKYNLACGYSLLGEKDSALDLLEELTHKGIDFGVDQDSDFDSIKNSDRFKKIVKTLNKIRKAVNNSELAYTIDEEDLIPEGIAYDPVNQQIFLSSIYKRKIISVAKDGTWKDFTAEKQDGLYATLGMKVDSARQNLWICCSASNNMKDFKSDDSGKAAIYKYSLSGELLRIYPSPNNKHHEFNDLAINSAGDVYITDSQSGELFFIHHDRDSLELLFEPGHFSGSNGITLSTDENILFVAAYSEGIYSINLSDLRYSLISIPDNINLYGIDGLYFYDNSLIAVQNGLRPHRIARYLLNNNLTCMTGVEIIEMNNELFNEPTTGVIAGDFFYYIANSQLSSFDREGKILTLDQLKPVSILKTNLQKQIDLSLDYQ